MSEAWQQEKQGGEKQGLENGVKISLGGEKKQSTHPPQPKVEVDPELARQQAAEMASYLERHDVHGLVQSLVADLVAVRPSPQQWLSFCQQRLRDRMAPVPALGRAYGRLLEMRLDRGPEAISDALADAFNFFAPERMGRAPLVSDYVMLLRALLRSTWPSDRQRRRQRVVQQHMRNSRLAVQQASSSAASSFSSSSASSAGGAGGAGVGGGVGGSGGQRKDLMAARLRRLLVPKHMAALARPEAMVLPDFAALSPADAAVLGIRVGGGEAGTDGKGGRAGGSPNHKHHDPLLDAVLEGEKQQAAAEAAAAAAGEGGGGGGGGGGDGDTTAATGGAAAGAAATPPILAAVAAEQQQQQQQQRRREPVPLAAHCQPNVQFVVFAAGLRAAVLCRQLMVDVRRAFAVAAAEMQKQEDSAKRNGGDGVGDDDLDDDDDDDDEDEEMYGKTKKQQQSRRRLRRGAGGGSGAVGEPVVEIGALLRALPERVRIHVYVRARRTCQ
jgi:hypothetical protein